MSDQIQFLTPQVLQAIETRLEYLRNVRRPEVAEILREAVENSGNLAESSAYADAKHEQAFIEGEIQRLETILSNFQIIENNSPRGIVSLGKTVKVQQKGQKRTETFQIVGVAEANPAEGRISNESPLGQALMGHRVGEQVTVECPDGAIHFTIKAIH